MIKFDKPINLNGTELRQELNAIGVVITDRPSSVKVDNGDLWLDIAVKDKTKAQAIVDAHNGTTVPPKPTVADKLQSVGLNVEDLKAALGL